MVIKNINKMAEIAISLSGGGYRAAVFHLGVLSYLQHLKLKDGTPKRLLDDVKIMSTVSGGTITGLWHLLGEINEIPRSKNFSSLYDLLRKNNIATDVLYSVDEKDAGDDISLIKELADKYDEVFFHGEKFGPIMDYTESAKGIHHYAAYSTDLKEAVPFLFQATKDCNGYGIIGNDTHIIDRDDAREIFLADILAASSCFPIVFEPIKYPSDFYEEDDAHESRSEIEDFSLMDGGILDNQGVDYCLKAEEHLEKTEKTANDNCIDLAIISDASYSSNKDEDKTNKDWKFWIKYGITFAWLRDSILWLLGQFSVASLAMVIASAMGISFLIHLTSYSKLSIVWNSVFGAIEGALFTILIILALVFFVVPIKKNRKGEFKMPWLLPWTITFAQYVKLGEKRMKSVTRMVNTVMMSHMRKTNIKILTSSTSWKNRFVIAHIGFFTHDGEWKEYAESDETMKDLERIWKNSDMAANHATKLWFSNEDLRTKRKKGEAERVSIPDAILACGQYTICWQLLRWIRESKKTRKNQDESHKELKKYEDIISADWQHFKEKPTYLVSRLKYL